jgi:hypothetical protein
MRGFDVDDRVEGFVREGQLLAARDIAGVATAVDHRDDMSQQIDVAASDEKTTFATAVESANNVRVVPMESVRTPASRSSRRRTLKYRRSNSIGPKR